MLRALRSRLSLTRKGSEGSAQLELGLDAVDRLANRAAGVASSVMSETHYESPPATVAGMPAPESGSRPGGAETLPFESKPRVAGPLFDRLRAFGLPHTVRVTLTRNRSVMVSFRGGTLRLHEGFAEAPDDVLRAVVVFMSGRGAARRAARRLLLAHQIPREHRAPSRREGMHPDDAPLAARLQREHARLNAERFAGTLRSITLRVSRRMKSRLGHYAPAASAGGAEIVISRRHIRRHGWPEAIDTLLHEMVHQWQDESAHPIDHGALFREKAREVGALPRARRTLR
jgi:hypothetical protein